VTPARLLLATRSEGKLRELRPLFALAGFEVLDLEEAALPAAPEEEGLEKADSFEANALAKARYFYQRSGMPTVADDSGLEVVALGGAPGVRSKRWSGRADLTGALLDRANNDALLAALAPHVDRRARYVCVAAFAEADRELTARGETTGRILDEPRGGSGFGYDPLFLSDDLGMTFGQVDGAAKARVSHRGRAFRGLLAALGARR
jgi:XTP/dITP diphosphohydrolase